MDIMQQTTMGPSDFEKEVEKLKSAGKMPQLHEVLGAVADTRQAYRSRILEARKKKEGEEVNASND